MPATPAVPLVRWGGAARLGAAVAMTTRHGGVSSPPYDSLNLALHVGDRPAHVATNRARAAASFGVCPGSLVFAHQTHGTRSCRVGPPDAGRGLISEDDARADTDILVTTSPGITLVILVADCVPLALVDPVAGVLAAVHAGWRGAAAGAVPHALAAMQELGADPTRTVAYVGPAVAQARYQVSDHVHHALADALGTALDDTVARPDGPGHWRVDLVEANRRQLLHGGLAPERVVVSGLTTTDDRFFSDRARRPCGRQALLARLLWPVRADGPPRVRVPMARPMG